MIVLGFAECAFVGDDGGKGTTGVLFSISDSKICWVFLYR